MAPRIPRKKGQRANSKKHSDLYTDENPKGTIKGLGFATVKDAQASVNKIKSLVALTHTRHKQLLLWNSGLEKWAKRPLPVCIENLLTPKRRLRRIGKNNVFT